MARSKNKTDELDNRDGVFPARVPVQARSGKWRWIPKDLYEATKIPVSQEFLDRHQAPESFWTDDAHA